jgi:hypothetical protein
MTRKAIAATRLSVRIKAEPVDEHSRVSLQMGVDLPILED